MLWPNFSYGICCVPRPAAEPQLSSIVRGSASSTTRRSHSSVHEVHSSRHERLLPPAEPVSECLLSFAAHAVHVPPDLNRGILAFLQSMRLHARVRSLFAPHAARVPSDHDAGVRAEGSSHLVQSFLCFPSRVLVLPVVL